MRNRSIILDVASQMFLMTLIISLYATAMHALDLILMMPLLVIPFWSAMNCAVITSRFPLHNECFSLMLFKAPMKMVYVQYGYW